VFDNILHQNVISQIKEDIEGGKLAPALLFAGPEFSGKGTSALELARVISCEAAKAGKWNCSCPGCGRHRLLVSPDLLLLGSRRFFEEIAAASRCCLGDPENHATRLLFSRAVRKLLARFSPVLWEDEPKIKKISGLIADLEEDLEDFARSGLEKEKREKRCETILKNAARLEAEGLGEQIPVSMIRRASYWSRLAPLGKHKCIIIENAERMQEGAKNSLLKILEEPPARVTIVLTSSRPGSLLPTVLSRLRLYQFAKRRAEAEAEVVRRIFREEYSLGIGSYLESFLPVGDSVLYPLGAWFAASTAAAALRDLRRQKKTVPPPLVDMGKFAAPIAEQGGLGRPASLSGEMIARIVKTCDGFQIPHVTRLFFKNCYALVSAWLRSGAPSPEKTACAELWRTELDKSAAGWDTYNISPVMILEGLAESLVKGMAR
jgi:DNA polymerase-3 subunit gamma/tau